MTWRRALLWILALYPSAWRDRYRRETTMVIDDLLDDPRRQPVRLATNLLWGACKERVRPTVAKRPVSPVAPPYQVSLLFHRDALGRKKLDPPALALLEPGEHVVGTFDAVTNHPSILRWSLVSFGVSVGWPLGALLMGHVPSHADLVPTLVYGPLSLLGLLFLRVTHSRWVVFVLTTHGLVQCEVDWLYRPRAVTTRSPALAPELLARHWMWRRIALGESTVWVNRSADPVLHWMTRAIA